MARVGPGGGDRRRSGDGSGQPRLLAEWSLFAWRPRRGDRWSGWRWDRPANAGRRDRQRIRTLLPNGLAAYAAVRTTWTQPALVGRRPPWRRHGRRRCLRAGYRIPVRTRGRRRPRVRRPDCRRLLREAGTRIVAAGLKPGRCAAVTNPTVAEHHLAPAAGGAARRGSHRSGAAAGRARRTRHWRRWPALRAAGRGAGWRGGDGRSPWAAGWSGRHGRLRRRPPVCAACRWCRSRRPFWGWSMPAWAARWRWTCRRARTWWAHSSSPRPGADRPGKRWHTLPEIERRAGLAEIIKHGSSWADPGADAPVPQVAKLRP